MEPLFSIGVTTYDRVDMLKEALSSILNQTFGDFEIIVANDNPARIISGETLGITDPRIRYINHQKNLGEYNNMNFLLQESKGRYFTWLADDDLYLPEYLEAVYKAIVQYSFPQCIFTSFAIIQKGIKKNSRNAMPVNNRLLKGTDFLYQYCKGKLKTISVMGFFEEKTIKNIGGIEDISNDNKGLLSEYMLIVRASTLDKVVYIKEPLVIFRDHDGSWVRGNIDLGMYRRAANNLIKKSIDVFKLPKFRKHFYTYLYAILKIAILNNISAMFRRREQGDKSVKKVLSYLISNKSYISSLKGTRLYLLGLVVLIHVEISVLFYLVGCMIKKAFKKY